MSVIVTRIIVAGQGYLSGRRADVAATAKNFAAALNHPGHPARST
jgi:hypothetical protein